ncbi:DNA-binding protein [Kocuria koreensis]|uniref:DNA-binding protein n=2 Tax=Rothia koreensis TaxID=592378 RepID=A0A7K1LHV1_9MICC|nr:DNA-binding protein [Rothia koreensis]
MQNQKYASPQEIAEYLLTTEAKLANDRYHGVGLPYTKFGRKILYSWEAVEAYLEKNTVNTTKSQAGQKDQENK